MLSKSFYWVFMYFFIVPLFTNADTMVSFFIHIVTSYSYLFDTLNRICLILFNSKYCFINPELIEVEPYKMLRSTTDILCILNALHVQWD